MGFKLRSHDIPLILGIMALAVIMAGGFVRIEDAGESCPDWPTCFGTWGFDVSESEQGEWYAETGEYDSRGENHRYTTFEIFTEWFHRLIATMSGLVVIAGLLFMRQDDSLSEENWKAGKLALILVVTQGILGAVTVRFDNASWTVMLHLLFALIYTSGLFWWWLLWRRDCQVLPRWATVPVEIARGQKKRLLIMLAHAIPVLILGVWISTGEGGSYNQGCSVGWMQGWPLCQGALIPEALDNPAVHAAWVHRLAVLVVAVVLAIGMNKFRNQTDGKAQSLERIVGLGVLFYFLNILAGAAYVILAAGPDGFPEHLSLLHLGLASDSVLLLAFGWILCSMNLDTVVDEAE